ncbi:MAG: tetratricopeptide repeat protein [Fuerstiella sp.]
MPCIIHGHTLTVLVLLFLIGCGKENENKLVRPSARKKSADQQIAAVPDPVADAAKPSADVAPTTFAKHFVGSQACNACHSGIADEYKTHPMSHSMFATSQGDGLEDLSTSEFTTLPEFSYQVESHDGKVFHHERRTSGDGELVYDQAIPIDLSVGSGERGRSYLTNVDGRLNQSMISWYADGPKWGLSPGYAPEFNERFERRVTHACLSCHSGRANPHPTDNDRFAEPAFHEHAIGCERCHGAGGEHIDFHQAKPDIASTDPIVNPIHLSSARRDAVCTQCHLQGRRRVLQVGQSEYGFRPGMNLSDIWVTLVKTEGVKSGTAAAVSQVEQMYSSVCYQQSSGELTCISCHDPHSRPPKTERAVFYRQRCLQCHETGKTECSEPLTERLKISSADSCVACHMPTFGAADVHASQTDHRILKQVPQQGRSENPDAAPEIIVFDEPGVNLSDDEVNRALGVFQAELAYLNGDSKLAQQAVQVLIPLVEQNQQDVDCIFALGKAMVQAGQPQMAARAWSTVLQIQPRHEDALEAMASMMHQTGQLEEARKAYEQLHSVNPTRSRYLGRMAHVMGQLREFPKGIEAAEAALKIDPSLALAHGWLSEAYLETGDTEKAQQHAKMFEKLTGTSKKSSE